MVLKVLFGIISEDIFFTVQFFLLPLVLRAGLMVSYRGMG
jgi:hypothetical protein